MKLSKFECKACIRSVKGGQRQDSHQKFYAGTARSIFSYGLSEVRVARMATFAQQANAKMQFCSRVTSFGSSCSLQLEC